MSGPGFTREISCKWSRVVPKVTSSHLEDGMNLHQDEGVLNSPDRTNRNESRGRSVLGVIFVCSKNQVYLVAGTAIEQTGREYWRLGENPRYYVSVHLMFR